jgi:hypothetical protein
MPSAQVDGLPLPLRLVRRIALFSGIVVDLLHERLQRAPADFAQVAVVVRHELLTVADAIDADVGPSEVVVGFAEAAITDKSRFHSHGGIRGAIGAPSKRKAAGSPAQCHTDLLS